MAETMKRKHISQREAIRMRSRIRELEATVAGLENGRDRIVEQHHVQTFIFDKLAVLTVRNIEACLFRCEVSTNGTDEQLRFYAVRRK